MLLIDNIVLNLQVCSRISLSGVLSLLLIVVVVADCYHSDVYCCCSLWMCIVGFCVYDLLDVRC